MITFYLGVRTNSCLAKKGKSTMATDQILQQKDWTEQELLENGFRYYERKKSVVLARELPPEEAPLRIIYENDFLYATAGYMICFLRAG